MLLPRLLLLAMALLLGPWEGHLHAAEELLPRDERNVSIRNELETARSKGLAYLQARQQADGSWPVSENPLRDQTRDVAATLLLKPGAGSSDAWRRQLARALAALAAELKEASDAPPLNVEDYVQAWQVLAAHESLEPLSAHVWKAMREADVKQVLDAHSPQHGGLTIRRRRWALEGTAPLLRILLTSPDVSANLPAWNATAAWDYLSRCQKLEGPETGGFSSCPPGLPKMGALELVNLPATIHAFWLEQTAAPKSAMNAQATAALAWLGAHQAQLQREPFVSLLMLGKTLRGWQLETLTAPNGQKLDWARAWTERLVNEQNSDGSWSPIPKAWPEREILTNTCDALQLVDLVYGEL